MIEYYSKKNAITAFKAFNEDFTCRSFQYEVGKSYHIDGMVETCKRGFHACTNPFDVFAYYSIFNTKIAIVKLWGIVDMQLALDNHTMDIYNGKICASDIYIEKEINYFDLIPYFIKFAETQRGEFDFLVCSHDKLISDKQYIFNNSCYSQIFLNKNFVQCTSAGHYNNMQINGSFSTLILTGDYNNVNIIGDRAKVISNFNNNKIIINGNLSHIYSQGTNTDITVFGDEPRIYSKGEKSRIVCFGNNPCIKASKGSCILLSDDRSRIGKLIYVDGHVIKEDVWYTYCKEKPVKGIYQMNVFD